MSPIRLLTTTRHPFSRFPRVSPVVTALVVVSLQLTGCSILGGGEDTEPDSEPTSESAQDLPAKELGAEEKNAPRTPEGEMFREAQRLFQSKMFSLSKQGFQNLYDQYPMGAYAEFAEVKLADAHFYGNEFAEAAKRYEEYARSHPASANIPYVTLQAARSLVLSSKGGGRDRNPREKALTLFDSVIEKFPNTAYAAAADKERLKVVEELSSYDKMIMEFYQRRENTAAVEARRKHFNQRWSAALTPKVSSQILLDSPMLPRANSADPLQRGVAVPDEVLVAGSDNGVVEPPLSPPALHEVTSVVARVDGAPTREEPSPIQDKDEKQGLARAVEPATAARIEPISLTVRRIVCRDQGIPLLAIEVANDLSQIPQKLLRDPLLPDDGYVVLKGVRMVGMKAQSDCFAESDLQITEDMELRLESDSPMSVTTLSNPSRLLLTPG